MRPVMMNETINGKRYRTETATLIASDTYWDGSNHERHGRNTFLYKTRSGNFFLQHQTQWEGERDSIVPISVEEAKESYENLTEHEVEYEEAFGEGVPEA